MGRFSSLGPERTAGPLGKTIVAGVGYRNMRDLSLGPVLTDRLAQMAWPAHVDVDADFSYGPIAIVQRFQAEPGLCQRLVLFGAISRRRPAGAITAYRWHGDLPPEDEIQARVGEAVTGVVSLDNLLVIGEYFGIWPEELFVVEVEPADEGWGPGFSDCLAERVEEVVGVIRRTALEGEVKISRTSGSDKSEGDHGF